MKNIHRINELIYITSEDDINENDYIVTKDERIVQVSYLLSKDLEGARKIILTNDPALISVGIQAIDPDAVKWLNENPSCEWVEHELVKFEADMGLGESCIEYGSYYKINLSTNQTIEEAAETYTEQQVFNLILLSSNMQFKSIQEVKIWITENKQQC